MGKKVLVTLVTVVLVSTLIMGAASAAIGTATTTTGVRLRSGAGTDYSIITTLYYGTSVSVLEDNGNGWYKVDYNGTVGYMCAQYLAYTAGSSSDSQTNSGTAAYVNANKVRFRAGPSTDYDIIDTLNSGTVVTITADAGSGWYQISYNGTAGYMYGQYVTTGTPAASSGSGSGSSDSQTTVTEQAAYITGSYVRLRSEPSTSANIIDVTMLNDACTVTGTSGDWYSVTYNGNSGYIYGQYIAFGTAPVTEYNSDVGAQVVAFAKQYLGYSYVWGGASPSTGFDCSGFVSYVFKSLGYSTNRTAADIYLNGTYVAKDSLQPGDAVFFSSSSNSIGHVGIYIGDGNFIHSSSGCGYVTISALSESYYTRTYVGARRIAT